MASRAAAALAALLLLLYTCPARGQCSNATALSMQLDALLALLDREAPPPDQRPVRLTLSLDIRHAAVHQWDSTVRLLADLRMKWNDKRLEWNASEWGCDSGLVPAERLWLPDVVLLNAAASGAGGGGDTALRARLSSDGAVAWVTRLDLTAPVALALQDWPADTHTCTFKFGSRMYSKDELELTISDFKHAVVFESGAWEVESVVGSSDTWARGGVQASVAAWTVRVRRRAPAHALAAGAVLLAVLLALAAAAALPPARRAPLAAAAATIAAMWLISALSWLPGAGSVPRAVRAMCAACASAGAVCAAGAAAHALAACRAPPPRCLRPLLARASLLCDLTPHEETGGAGGAGAWAGAARLADACARAALALTIIILAALYFL